VRTTRARAGPHKKIGFSEGVHDAVIAALETNLRETACIEWLLRAVNAIANCGS
jgi:hypothetical protein